MKVCAVGPRVRTFTSRVRQFSTQASVTQAPIIFVKDGQEARSNPLLGPSDKQFPLPGDVSHCFAIDSLPNDEKTTLSTMETTAHSLSDILSATRIDADLNHLRELQEKALEEAQERAGDWPIELTAQECPRLLKKDLKLLFPGMALEKSSVNVLNLTQKSDHDMSAWSRDMEDERELLTASFIASGQAICNALRQCGYWADFVDPSSGRPFLGQYSNHALFETDEAYKFMGFRIEDLGCCRVLKHVSWGTHAFVGTLFTDAPLNSTIVKDILSKVNDDSDVDLA